MSDRVAIVRNGTVTGHPRPAGAVACRPRSRRDNQGNHRHKGPPHETHTGRPIARPAGGDGACDAGGRADHRPFLDPGNLSNLALQVSIVSLVAIGATIVIFAGGIDLSSGSMVALLTMVLATLVKTMGLPLWPTLLGVLILGTVLGV